MKRLALLALAAVAIGCGPKVKTDCQLLGRSIGPDSRIRCVANFAVLRWQQDGLVLSTMDSWRLGREYLGEVCERLRRKGYSVENGGVVDVNWMFHDGARVPVVRKSGFWFGRKYDTQKKKDTPSILDEAKRKERRKEKDDEPKLNIVFSQGRKAVEYEPEIWGKEETVPIAPHKTSEASQPFQHFVLNAVRRAAPLLLAPRDIKKQEECDAWTATVLGQRVCAPAELARHTSERDLLLLCWGSAVTVSRKQHPLAPFRGILGGQPEEPWSGTPGSLCGPTVMDRDLEPYVPTEDVDDARNLVELRGVLLDRRTGQILWFTAEQQAQKSESDENVTCIFLSDKQRSFARDLLWAFPAARHLGTEESYGKLLSNFKPHQPPD
jgi:hypothetical protein